MKVTRREVLQAGCAVVAASAVGQAAEPVLGMIYPQKVAVTAETLAMYPAGVKFLIEGVGLQTMTPAGYDSVIDKIRARGSQAQERRGAGHHAHGHVAQLLSGRRV